MSKRTTTIESSTVDSLTRFRCCNTVRGRLSKLSAFVGESVKGDDVRWMPCNPEIFVSKSDWLISPGASSLNNSPKVGRHSIDVPPRSDFTSNLATVTPSLSVAVAKVRPMKTVDAIPLFNIGISGGILAFDGVIMPLDNPPR